ncbi:hypothetical protein F8388_023981 [Cannabis sativa]|uniref:Phosphofructokinase domain-containing protein n=1 Tax=Cannabis sativa TaxID=3483 RepID=A0A7J6EWS3_CANSA|nr:hypothetical protein F8388_023981 [Cannabis sativa]
MGRHSGFIAMHATLASRDVDCCLIPESPFYLEGPGGLFEYIKRRLKENGHMVIVVAEGAGQENLSENTRSINQQDASGNKLLKDVGLWLTQKIKDHFSTQQNININLKYIDPTYMIRAVPSNASDNVSCTLLAQSAVHGAMAGYTGFTVGPVNGRHAYIPFHRINEKQNKVVITDRMWARLLCSTNQPSFLNAADSFEDDHKENETEIHAENGESEPNGYNDHTTNHKHYIPTTTSNSNSTTEMITPKIVTSDNGYILEDVPHLSDYLTDLTTHPNPLQYNQTYSAVRQCFVGEDDSVAQQIVVQKDGPRGPHFRRAGPRQTVSFEPEEVNACIVTCGGLCPGLNTVIREIVCCLHHMYGVNTVHGIEVYIIGGDGTQKGASVIFEEIRRRGLKVAVAGIPKTIDNDIPVIDKSFGFDTAVEEAQRAINAAHVEAESFENGIGVVKLMGRHSGFIAMYASIASRDVDCCLIPESPFYLEGPGGLFEYIKRRLQENGHMVIVVAEGAGQENLSENTRNINQQDASGNKLLQDVGLWLTQKIKDYFSTQEKININLKYIDPTYMIRAIPSNASDNISCTLLAQSAVHGAMAGYTGFTIGPVNGRHAYIPFHRINERQNKVVVTDRMWARLLLGSTNQPSFLNAPDTFEDDHTEIHSENEESEENDHTTNHRHYIPTTTSNSNSTTEMITPKIVTSDNGYILEDVPHLFDYLTDLTVSATVRQCFVGEDDSVAQQIVVQKDGPRGPHFRRAGPRQKVLFEPEEVNACIVTCGGLCPGLNTVIREIVCCLHHMYGVNTVHGIEVYIIGGDGTQKGASVIFEEIRRRGLKVAVAGIPKTIDNDIPVIDKSFGFDTAVEDAQRAINAAHVEAESFENGIGVVKLMGRHSGFIAMYASIASRDVDCCLIPESPFYLEGPGGLFEYIKRRLQENGHMVIVVAEGAGQENLSENTRNINQQDASGNKLLQDVGLWLTQKIKDYFSTQEKININLKYIDPTYMIRAIPSNASDNICCTLLAQSAVHGAMAGYTGFTIGPVNGRHAYIPFHRINERQNKVVVTDRMWARLLLGSTNQPSFLNAPDSFKDDHTEIYSENGESEENDYHGQFLFCD